MAVWSIFEFRFPESSREEGLRVAKAIGADMPAEPGFQQYQVIRDVADPGHIMVNTLWDSTEIANGVLSRYSADAKVTRATDLIGQPPTGFLGELLTA